MLINFFDRILFNATLILGIAGIIYFYTSRKFNNRYGLMEQFLEEEMEANTARRREVEPENFYSPKLEGLPIRKNAEGDVAKKQERVISSAQQTMVRFPEKMTNLELKKAYGVMNLEKVTGYEENYNRYVMALVNWADSLLASDSPWAKADAIAILETTLEMGSEFRKTYMHLADYYYEKSNSEGLNRLLDQVAESFSDEGIKRQLTQYIMNQKENL